MSEPSDPSDWSSQRLFGIAAGCLLPPPLFLAVGLDRIALVWAIAGIVVWYRLAARTRPGFPYLFGSLTLQVFGWSAVSVLWVIMRGLRALLER